MRDNLLSISVDDLPEDILEPGVAAAAVALVVRGGVLANEYERGSLSHILSPTKVAALPAPLCPTRPILFAQEDRNRKQSRFAFDEMC